MTSQELEKLKSDTSPSFGADKERPKSTSKQTEEEADEDSMLHWIWNKINPLYKSVISKEDFLRFLRADKEVREVFNLKEHELEHIVDAIVTHKPDHIDFDEFEVPYSNSVLHERQLEAPIGPSQARRVRQKRLPSDDFQAGLQEGVSAV